MRHLINIATMSIF